MLILVAEDFDDTRQVLKLLLELNGHRVSEASNGREAVERALEERPDAILMDLNMPVLDGLAAMRRLRTMEPLAGVPIFALSAQTDTVCREKALAAGFDEFFLKPLDFDALTVAIAGLRERRPGTSRPRAGGGGSGRHASRADGYHRAEGPRHSAA
jgi:CheY-like chemotaxis protein